MFSRFNNEKSSGFGLVTLPTFCTPALVSNDLDAKRDARLQWMRERGLTPLADLPAGRLGQAAAATKVKSQKPSRGRVTPISLSTSFVGPMLVAANDSHSDAA